MIQGYLTKLKTKYSPLNKLLSDFYTPLDVAVAEIEERTKNPDIFMEVNRYLNNDVPVHFNAQKTAFYLSRFIATPNFEALKVSEMADKYNYRFVIGEDRKSKLVSDNEVKVPLGKLPIVKGKDKNGNDIIEYFNIINFSNDQGKPLNEIRTITGDSLVDFHHNLFYKQNIINKSAIADETDWLDRRNRDDIYDQYKDTMALMCIYGIQFESFTPEEYDFFRDFVYPAFKDIERIIGLKPLVVEHITLKEEAIRNWNSYPSNLYGYIDSLLNK